MGISGAGTAVATKTLRMLVSTRVGCVVRCMQCNFPPDTSEPNDVHNPFTKAVLSRFKTKNMTVLKVT